MPRTRLYESDADRQQAYRDRVEAKRREAERIERERRAALQAETQRIEQLARAVIVEALRARLDAGYFCEDVHDNYKVFVVIEQYYKRLSGRYGSLS